MQARIQPPVKAVGAEPIPGYRLLGPLGSGGFGEVWKCEAPGGLHKAIKFVHGPDGTGLCCEDVNGAEQELRALQHVKSIRHPFLLSMDRVEHVGGELVIVMELADKSLHDLLQECQAAGRPGVPRTDLLLFMREAAEVLDLMNLEYGLEHLDIKPCNLFLVRDHVKVADFGLVNSLAELNGQNAAQFQLSAITPLYAAPESFQGKISLYSDQYSLAIVTCELLTGKLPFNGKNFRQLMLQHTQSEPDLAGLPEADRGAIARALAKDPRGRFPSSMDFVRALISREQAAQPAPETAVSAAAKEATMHDFCLVEKSRTAAILRPTRTLGRAAAENRSAPHGATAGAEQPRVRVDDLQFLDCLGRSPLGEMWKVESPDGSVLMLKLVNTFAPGGIFGEEDPASRLQALKHRGLLPTIVQAHPPNRLAVIAPLTADSLATRMQRHREAHLQGIPRDELLEYLGAAAATLDDLQKIYGTQHLGLNPRSIVFHNDQLQLADYGLVAVVWLPAGQSVAQINPRYCPPESDSRGVTALRHCDQYSLALLYHELLSGVHLFGNLTQRQLALARSSGRLNLDSLPAFDRAAIARALHPDPAQRFKSCSELIRALKEAAPGSRREIEDSGWTDLGGPRPDSGPLFETVLDPDPDRVIADMVASAAGPEEVREYRSARYVLRPGESIEHTCYARLVPGTLLLKLAGFREQWQAEVVNANADNFTFRVRLQSSFWKRCLGTQPGLEVQVQAAPAQPNATLTDVLVRIVPSSCGREEGAHALEKHGPPLVDSVRSHLQAGPERRAQPRLPFACALQVRPVLANNRLGEPILCQGRDISLGGMGLTVPCKPPASLVVQFQGSTVEAPVSVAAQVVRVQPCGDGHFDVGLRFPGN